MIDRAESNCSYRSESELLGNVDAALFVPPSMYNSAFRWRPSSILVLYRVNMYLCQDVVGKQVWWSPDMEITERTR
jgi:hypothetical protein